MIKVEHTLFALPIVLSSMLLAFENLSNFSWIPFFWILICFSSARATGMTLNRLIDWKIDARNPRTVNRAIPSSRVSPIMSLIYSLLSLSIFVFASLQLPVLCQKLLPIAILWLFAYSWLKRFTWISHFFLGTILGGAALGAWIAVKGEMPSVGVIYFCLAISAWVAGFDIIYSLQDLDFDKTNNLHSVPVKFGADNAIKISKFLHFLTSLFLYLAGANLGLGLAYKIGVFLVICVLIYEHSLVKNGQIQKAFFTANTWVSTLIMLGILVDILVRHV